MRARSSRAQSWILARSHGDPPGRPGPRLDPMCVAPQRSVRNGPVRGLSPDTAHPDTSGDCPQTGPATTRLSETRLGTVTRHGSRRLVRGQSPDGSETAEV